MLGSWLGVGAQLSFCPFIFPPAGRPLPVPILDTRVAGGGLGSRLTANLHYCRSTLKTGGGGGETKEGGKGKEGGGYRE